MANVLFVLSFIVFQQSQADTSYWRSREGKLPCWRIVAQFGYNAGTSGVTWATCRVTATLRRPIIANLNEPHKLGQQASFQLVWFSLSHLTI